MSNFLRPHGLQHSRLLSSTISPNLLNFMSVKSVMLSNHLILCHSLLLLPLVFPSIRASCGQSIGASASVLPMNVHGWFSLGLTALISLLSKGLSKVFSSTTIWKHQFFGAQPSLWSNSHICTRLLEKTIALTIQTFVGKVTSLLLNTLSRFAPFLPRSKRLLISWLQSQSAVILEPDKMWSTGDGNGKPLRYSYLT